MLLARKIQSLREELKLLKRQYKTAGEVERAGQADLRAILRKQLLTLRRAEFHRRRRKERARKRRSSSAPAQAECLIRCIKTAQSYYIGFGGP